MIIKSQQDKDEFIRAVAVQLFTARAEPTMDSALARAKREVEGAQFANERQVADDKKAWLSRKDLARDKWQAIVNRSIKETGRDYDDAYRWCQATHGAEFANTMEPPPVSVLRKTLQDTGQDVDRHTRLVALSMPTDATDGEYRVAENASDPDKRMAALVVWQQGQLGSGKTAAVAYCVGRYQGLMPQLSQRYRDELTAITKAK